MQTLPTGRLMFLFATTAIFTRTGASSSSQMQKLRTDKYAASLFAKARLYANLTLDSHACPRRTGPQRRHTVIPYRFDA